MVSEYLLVHDVQVHVYSCLCLICLCLCLLSIRRFFVVGEVKAHGSHVIVRIICS